MSGGYWLLLGGLGGASTSAPTVAIQQGAAITVAVGKVKFLTTTTTGAPAPTVGWESANEAVVTVSAAGAITGVAEGGPVNVTATATSTAGSANDVIAVTVVALTGFGGSSLRRRLSRRRR